MGSLQTILLWILLLYLGFEAYKGWKLGPIRILTRIVGLALAYLTGAYLGHIAAPIFKITGLPEPLLPLLGGALLGLIVYGAVCFIGHLFFKKTSQQEYGKKWFFYGLSGSLMGLAFGTFIVLSLGVGARVVSTFAHGVTAPAQEQSPNLPEDEIPNPPSATARQLASLKQSLETGLPGQILHNVDPIPERIYLIIGKLGRAVSSPLAAQRFLTYPGAIEIAQRPEIHRLRDNPEIAGALSRGNYLSLLNNREIAKVVSNPAIKALIQNFDIDAALDHALATTSPISTLPVLKNTTPDPTAAHPVETQNEDSESDTTDE